MNLTTEERFVLQEVLNQHLQGMEDAKDRMIEDNATLRDFDTFNEVMQRHTLDMRTVERIQQKLMAEVAMESSSHDSN